MDDWKAELAESFWEIERSNKMLRTMKDCDGDRWSEVAPDVWYDHPPASLRELEEQLGPLTDVTDTGEPLDTPDDAPRLAAAFAEPRRFVQRDTPRKPQPGDRVRVKTPNGNSFAGTYVTEYRAGKDQVSVVEDDCILTVTGHPEDLVWEVIEPARPAVPEDPKCMVINDDDEVFWWDPMDDDGQDYTDGNDWFDWPALWARSGPFHLVERGPVIGGSDE